MTKGTKHSLLSLSKRVNKCLSCVAAIFISAYYFHLFTLMLLQLELHPVRGRRGERSRQDIVQLLSYRTLVVEEVTDWSTSDLQVASDRGSSA